MGQSGHETVMLDEAVDALAIEGDRTAGTYVDATFGRGGHSRLILSRLGDSGRLFAFDRDPQAIEAARSIDDERFELIGRRFSEMGEALSERGVTRVDGVLFDLGVSSPQLDDAQRGFSFRADGPLDMRMDPTSGISAAEWLAGADEKEIERVVREYGEEKFASRVARAIVTEREKEPIATTARLSDIVSRAVKTREKGKHPATRTFQAIRIRVNEELSELDSALNQAWELLGEGSRLAVISFHSLEDRRVKNFMAGKKARPVDRRVVLRESELPAAEMKVFGKVRATEAEVAANPRSRSAILRSGVRLTGSRP